MRPVYMKTEGFHTFLQGPAAETAGNRVQLAWESKLIPTEKYSELSEMLEEIGRQLGGWKKGLETKLPPK